MTALTPSQSRVLDRLIAQGGGTVQTGNGPGCFPQNTLRALAAKGLIMLTIDPTRCAATIAISTASEKVQKGRPK